MRLATLFLLASLPALAACTARPQSAGSVIADADLTLAKVETGYAQAKMIADIFAPMLSAETASRIRALQARIEQALAAARRAVTLAEQLSALRTARAATIELSGVTSA